VDRDTIIETLLEVAREAMQDSTSTHPEDIVAAGIFAMESGAATLSTLMRAGKL
jgi:hypothetical protein